MIATTKQPRKLGKAVFSSGGEKANTYILELDAVAYHDQSYYLKDLHLISACGPGTSVKASAAILQRQGSRGCVWVDGLPELRRTMLGFGTDGFRCYQHRLAYDTWHLLAVSKAPGMMPNFSKRSIWAKLRSDAYTTPLLKGWMNWLAGALAEEKLVMRLDCYGQCDAGMITATPEDLDSLVTRGIQGGFLRLEE